jgi:MYXO-CTERM domain-containing protein
VDSRLTLEQIEADPALRSRDDDGVAAIAIGAALWVLALIAVQVWGSSWGVDTDRWTLVCAIGALLGLPGLALVLGRRRRRHRRQS